MQARHYPTVIIHTKRRSGIRKRRHAVLAALAAFHLMVTAAAADREVVACQYAAAGGEGESATAEPQRHAFFQVISLGLIGPKARQIDGIALGNIGISVKESPWGAGRQGGKI